MKIHEIEWINGNKYTNGFFTVIVRDNKLFWWHDPNVMVGVSYYVINADWVEVKDKEKCALVQITEYSIK